jgi:hypothetical protein
MKLKSKLFLVMDGIILFFILTALLHAWAVHNTSAVYGYAIATVLSLRIILQRQ